MAANHGALLFALQAAGTKNALAPLVKLIKEGKASPATEEGVLTLIAALGGPQELTLVLDHATDAKASAPCRAALLTALYQAARQRGVKPAGDLKAHRTASEERQRGAGIAAARVAGDWELQDARQPLWNFASGATTPEALRQAAIDGLAALGGPDSITKLDELSRDEHNAAARRMALIALASVDLAKAAKDAPEILKSLKDGEGAAEVFDAFIQRKNGAALLAAALSGQHLPPDAAKVGVRTVPHLRPAGAGVDRRLDQSGPSQVRSESVDGGPNESDDRGRTKIGRRGARRGDFSP